MKPVKYLKSFYIRDFLMIALGVSMYSVAYTGLILPNRVVTGGLSGVAAILNYTIGLPLYETNLWINIGLLVLAFKFISKQFVFKTIIGVGLLVFTLGIGETYLKPYFTAHPLLTDPFLSVILAGLMVGGGLGLVYSVDGSTGGTDIIGFITTKYFRISLAKILLIVDVAIVVSSFFILDRRSDSIEKTVYGLILLPVMWATVDFVLNGTKQSVQLFIFSKNYAEIATHINSEVKRGCTVLDGEGWYSKTPQKVIVVIVRKNEAASIFRLVDKIDPQAFVTKASVTGVYGNGFDKLK